MLEDPSAYGGPDDTLHKGRYVIVWPLDADIRDHICEETHLPWVIAYKVCLRSRQAYLYLD
jgi:hypothetical protein